MRLRFLVPAFVVAYSAPAALLGADDEPKPEGGKESAPASKEARGFLGILLAPVPEALRSHLKLEEGALVREVTAGSPADKSGLKAFDVIVTLGGESVKGPEEVKQRIRALKAGSTVKLGVRRGSESLNVEAKLGTVPEEEPRGEEKEAVKEERLKRGFLGVGASDVTPELAFHLKLKEGTGVIVSDVWKDSPAKKAGIEARDVIAAVDGYEVQGSADFVRLLGEKKAGEEVSLEVIHKGERKTVKVTLAPRPKERDLFWRVPFRWEPQHEGDIPFRPGPFHRGRIILRSPEGGEHSIEIPDEFFKAKDSAEELFRNIEKEFRELKDSKIPGIQEDLRRSLKELERRLREHDLEEMGDGEIVSTEDRFTEVKQVEGDYAIEVRDRNGVRTVTVKKKGKTIAEDLPYDKLDTLPADARERVRRVAESMDTTPRLKSAPSRRAPHLGLEDRLRA